MPEKQINAKIGKLGKHGAIIDQRSLNVSKYIKKEHLAGVPEKHDWTKKKRTSWGMMDNFNIMDCTCAAAGHMIECWTANSSTEHVIRDKAIVDAYIALSGYDAATKKNDTGVFAIDTLKYWRKNGIGNHKIKAFATIDHRNQDFVMAGIYFFGGIYVGLQLPNSIKGQDVWEVMPGGLKGNNEPGSFGGHAVTVLAYDSKHLTCISWGVEKKMTWEFWDTYCDEVYAIITEDFFSDKKSPLGSGMYELEKDLLEITKPVKEKALLGHGGGKGGAKAKELVGKKVALKKKATGSSNTRDTRS